MKIINKEELKHPWEIAVDQMLLADLASRAVARNIQWQTSW